MVSNFEEERQFLPKYSTYQEEALFGYRYIDKYIKSLPDGSQILEIGAGPCLLINQLSLQYKKHHFLGLEPLGEGFKFFSKYHDYFKKREKNFSLQHISYEDISPEKKWDLIYLINVFEHLPDWKSFLLFVQNHLERNGKCIVLCPNYAFPYESHFSIPVIINKKITYMFFRKKIVQFELKNDCAGLWESLNFVTLRDVKSSCSDLGLIVTSNNSIFMDMIERLGTDANFSKRHRAVSLLAKILNYFGFSKIFQLNLFSQLVPYMQLEITKSEKHE